MNETRQMNRIVLVAGLLAVVHADREDHLHQQTTALNRAQEEHRLAFAPISSSAKTLAEELRNLNTSSELAVDHYNTRVQQHDQAVTAYNKLSEALNASAQELNAASADVMAQCWTRPFLRADEEAILKERGRTAEPRRGGRRTAPPSTSRQPNEI